MTLPDGKSSGNDGLGNFFRRLVDRGVVAPLLRQLVKALAAGNFGAARAIVNKTWMKGIGEVLQLQLDRDVLRAVIHLAGEAEPWSVVIDDFEIDTAGPRPTITIRSLKSDRPWLESASRYAIGRPIELPEKIVPALEALGILPTS